MSKFKEGDKVEVVRTPWFRDLFGEPSAECASDIGFIGECVSHEGGGDWCINREPEMLVNEECLELAEPAEPAEPAGSYESMGKELGALVDEKQAAYGDSFGRAGAVLAGLYPDGIMVDQYDDVLAIVRIVDKLFRVANKKDAFGESPGRDIAGYGLLMARRHESDKQP